MRLAVSLALVALVAGPSLAQDSNAPFTIAETGQGYGRLGHAVAAIGAGQGTIVIAPGTYRDCAVQGEGRITFKAAVPGRVIFEREACENKATLVLRGQGAVVDGLIFRHLRVPDGNGAGIRFEAGTLDVRNAMFLDSEEGILGGDPGPLTIDRSTFSGLGRCDRGLSCAHSVYIGAAPSVTITRSRFERGTGGHYVKLRAPRVSITDSSFDDSAGRETNYMIDLSAGSTGTIARNTFVQGRSKENWTAFITVAAESRDNSSAGLTIRDNVASLAPGVDKRPAWVKDYAGEPMQIAANRLASGVREYERAN